MRGLLLLRFVIQLGLGALVLSALIMFGATIWLQRRPPVLTPTDVAVVLSGDISRKPDAPGEFSAARADRAAALWHAGLARRFIVTGRTLEHNVAAVSELMRDRMVAHGVPADVVKVEVNAKNTLENARFTAPILREYGIDHAILVTDDFHMARALALFAIFAPETRMTPAPSDGLRHVSPPLAFWVMIREIAAYPVNALRLIWVWLRSAL